MKISGERAYFQTGRRTLPAAADGDLLWSEYGFLLAAAAAAIVTVDPFEWRLAANPVIKHLALMILLPALLFTIAGRRLGAPLARQNPGRPLLKAAWPLIVLAAIVIGGSLYARLVLGIQNTFLNVGLYMLVTVWAAAMVLQTHAVETLLRGYFSILVAAAAVMSFYLVANFGVRQVYHEQIFLVIPLAALFFARGGAPVRYVTGIFFLSMAWFSQKYTAYLIGALTAVYLAVMIIYPRLGSRPALSRAVIVYWSSFVFVLAAATLIGLAQRNPGALPSGNLGYRLHTYAIAWERFTESPAWGTLFADEAVEKFTPYAIGIAGNILPTHSDILDLLAHGGVIGFLLWLAGLARIAREAAAGLLRPAQLAHPWSPYAHALALMSGAGIVTYAFNPILLQPSMAFLLWMNLGLLLGLALRFEESSPRAR